MRRLLALTLTLSLALASAAEARLVFTRQDGSVIHFGGRPRAWCGPWEQGVPRRSIHVAVLHPGRHWELSAVARDVKLGKPIRFPLFFVFDKPRGAQLFAADPPNEASTAEEEASGSMTFTRATCRHGGAVAFKVHAMLGSELSDVPPIRASGNFRGHVGRAPHAF